MKTLGVVTVLPLGTFKAEVCVCSDRSTATRKSAPRRCFAHLCRCRIDDIGETPAHHQRLLSPDLCAQRFGQRPFTGV